MAHPLVVSVLLVSAITAPISGADRTLEVAKTPNIPGKGTYIVGYAGESIRNRDFVPFAMIEAGKSATVRSDKSADVYYRPDKGIPVVVRKGWEWSGANKLDPERYLGTVRIDRDNLPRLGRIVLTAENDAGPDEKGHVPVQSVEDERDELVAPAGEYAVWVTPFNGARSERILDRVRIQGGKRTLVE